MKLKAIHIYVGAVALAAATLLAFHDWPGFLGMPRLALFGFAALAVLGLLSEASALSYTVGQSAGSSSITFIPALSCVLLFGPTATLLFLLLTGAVGEFAIRKKPPLKAVFNVAQWVVSAAIAGAVFLQFGGMPLASTAARGLVEDFAPQIGPFIAFGLIFIGINHVLVSLAIALSQDLSFRHVWSVMVGRSGTYVLYDLLVSPVAIVVAFLYFELGITGLFIVLLPLYFIRHAYLTNHRLQAANQDLLNALVKAIETRDPYTSGHSLRVSSLSRSIAVQMNLSAGRMEAVERAALLHDIGKIDAVYSDILRKPGDLSQEEREIIESHVIKGEEILKSLSSFKADVLDAVRHHHERIDGQGYPDGLRGEEIPLGARIIKVCDAIDAMLSDRPYRKALQLDEVRRQLHLYAGVQFDQGVVDAVVVGDFLEEFAQGMPACRTVEDEATVSVALAGTRRQSVRVG